MLPRSLEIPLCYNPTDDPVCHGEVADLWKGHYKGQRVAAQVLRLLQGGDADQVRRVSCRWRSRLFICVNNRSCLVEVLQGGRNMEGPPSSKRATVVGRYDDRESARDGIRVDVKW